MISCIRRLSPGIPLTLLLLVCGCSKKVSNPVAPAPPPEATLANVLAFQTDWGAKLDSLIQTHDTAMSKQAVLDIILKETSLVKSARVNSQGIAIDYTTGHRGGIMIDPEDMAKHSMAPNENSDAGVPQLRPASMPNSRRSLFLCPIYSERKEYADDVIAAVDDNLRKAGFDAFETHLDSDCGIDRFADIKGYGIIHIYTYSYAWPLKSAIEDVYAMTGDTVSADLIRKYSADLSSRNICPIYVPGRGNVLFISPQFISERNVVESSRPIVYLAFGYGFLGKWLVEIKFVAKAGVIITYDWRVFADRNRDWACEFYNVMSDTTQFEEFSIRDWYDTITTFYIDPFETTPPLPHRTSIRYHGTSDMTLWESLRLQSVIPSIGLIGSNVELRGTGFGDVKGTSEVMFGDVPAQIQLWSDKNIKAIVPNGCRTSGVYVTVNGKETNRFVYVVAKITGIDPRKGIYGDTITISGYGFGDSKGDNEILLNHEPLNVVSWSDSAVAFEIPTGSVSGQVYARLFGQISNDIELKVYGISSFSPLHATYYGHFTALGSELEPYFYDHYITFNGVAAPDTPDWGMDEIHGRVPLGSSTGDMVVTINGESTRGYPVEITGISDIQPRWGGERCRRVITGTGFGETPETVLFNEIHTTEILSWNDTLIELNSPLNAVSGPVHIVLPDLETNEISVRVMRISKLLPNWGLAGDTISIYGENLREYKITDSVVFGENLGQIIYWSDTMVNAITPPLVATSDVRLHVHGEVSNGVRFTVGGPPAAVSTTGRDRGTSGDANISPFPGLSPSRGKNRPLSVK